MAIEAKHFARVVELVYTHDSKSCAARLVGSSPTSGTSNYHTLPARPVHNCSGYHQALDDKKQTLVDQY